MKDDLISRQAAIDFIDAGHLCNPNEPRWSDNEIVNFLKSRPSAQPEPCGDVVSRNAIVQKLNEMDRYVSTELRLCDTDKKFPQNEVFIVDDVYEEIVEQLPSASPDLSGYSDKLWKAAYERGKAEAQAERKKGKWIIYVISMLDGEGCKCSECGFEGVPYWDYRPNCGAKMEDEQE